MKNELETKGKRKVLILGKLPPPFMGPSVAFQLIIQSGLKDIFNLLHLDIKANESLASLGKWSIRKLFINFQKYRQLAAILSTEKPELVLLPVSQSTIGFLKDSIYLIICIFYRRKVVIQLRGGNFRNWYNSTSFVSRHYIKFILGKTCGVIVQGNNLKQLFKGFFSEENIFVVPNGGDFVFGDRPVKTGNTVKITYLGNLQPSKGIEDILEAIRILNSSHSGKFVLEVAGAWRNAETRERCFAVVKAHKLPVTFLNGLSGPDKFHQLISSDIFVFTPREPEGHPWVIIEAMAAGLPVIATNQGAIAETVADGSSGYIVKTNDPSAIADKLKMLLEDPDLRTKMGAKSREIYLERYTEKCMVENFAHVFNELLDRK